MAPEYDDTAFFRETIVNVDAAVVGISRKRWPTIDGPEPQTHEALDIMRRSRFQVVRTKGLYRLLGFASGAKFRDALGLVVTLRDAVGHTVTSLIKQADSILHVWHAIEHILTILPRLPTA